MPPEELTPDEIKTVKRWYREKSQELGLGKKPVLSYFGFEGLALRWKRKYGALDIGDFRATIDLLLSFEENMSKEGLERLAKREEEFVPEEEYIQEKEPTAIETLEEEVLTMQDQIRDLERAIKEKISVAEARGFTPEDISPHIKELQTVRERQDLQTTELERINKMLDELIRVGKPIKEEVPIVERPLIIKEPSEVERIVGVAPELEVEYGLYPPEPIRIVRGLYCKRCRKEYPPYTAAEKRIIDDTMRSIEFHTQKRFHPQVFLQAYETCPECLFYLYNITFPKRR